MTGFFFIIMPVLSTRGFPELPLDGVDADLVVGTGLLGLRLTGGPVFATPRLQITFAHT